MRCRSFWNTRGSWRQPFQCLTTCRTHIIWLWPRSMVAEGVRCLPQGCESGLSVVDWIDPPHAGRVAAPRKPVGTRGSAFRPDSHRFNHGDKSGRKHPAV
jgi:hypothetical protein